MKIEDMHISISPLTSNIYINTFNKNNTAALQKIERTNEFLYAVKEYFKDVRLIEVGGKKYKVTMEEING